jgi:hypothetical protein
MKTSARKLFPPKSLDVLFSSQGLDIESLTKFGTYNTKFDSITANKFKILSRTQYIMQNLSSSPVLSVSLVWLLGDHDQFYNA